MSQKINKLFMAIILFLVFIIGVLFYIVFNESTDEDELFVVLSDVSIDSIQETLLLTADYLLRNQDDFGKIEYIYFPDSRIFSTDNNLIRQFMTTYSLNRMYNYTLDESYLTAFNSNLRFNIDSFYRENFVDDKAIGFVLYDGSGRIKLGSSALAYVSMIKSTENYVDKHEKST